jgi:hypothetical protein
MCFDGDAGNDEEVDMLIDDGKMNDKELQASVFVKMILPSFVLF